MSLTLKDLRRLGPVSCACGEHDDILGYYEPTIADIVEVLKNEGAEEAESLGVRFHDPEGKDALILAVESRGWRLEPGRYLVFRLDQ